MNTAYPSTARYAGQGGCELQLSRFSTGGFVLHRVKVVGYRLKFSAWYKPDGELLDAEGFDVRGRSQHVSAKARAELTLIGKRYTQA